MAALELLLGVLRHASGKNLASASGPLVSSEVERHTFESRGSWFVRNARLALASRPAKSICTPMTYQVHIIGGGLAGSEAAWQLAQAGVQVRLSEMRGGGDMTPAHQTEGLAEMVCSNSFRSDDAERNAVGLLHAEMRAMGSLIMTQADKAKVPAGSALAVDRDVFSQGVTRALRSEEHTSELQSL